MQQLQTKASLRHNSDKFVRLQQCMHLGTAQYMHSRS